MGIIDFFKKKENTVLSNSAVIIDIIKLALKKKEKFNHKTAKGLFTYDEFQIMESDIVSSLSICINMFLKLRRSIDQSIVFGSKEYLHFTMINDLMGELVERKKDLTENELLKLTELFVTNLDQRKFESGIPYKPLLSKIEIVVKKTGLSNALSSALNLLIIKNEEGVHPEILACSKRCKYLLSGELADSSDVFGRALVDYLNSLPDENIRRSWRELIKLHIETKSKPNPSEKWKKQVHAKINEIEISEVVRKYDEWLSICTDNLKQIHKNSQGLFYLNDINHDILKGIIWSCGMINDTNLNTRIDEYGLLAFKKLSGVGAISVRTGNACLYCFSILPFKEGISRLTKFKMKIKYASVLKQIENYISIVAEKEGYSKDKLEELAVPNFGINKGLITKTVGDYRAQITIENIHEINLKWEIADKQQNSIPEKIKNDHKEELNDIKKVIKEIESILPAQKDRIEKLYMKSRTWNFNEWVESYISHPLISVISKKLIWHFSDTEKSIQGFYLNNEFVDTHGNPITWLNEKVNVQLWHPIGFSQETVLSWREFLERSQIKQPFKQAYREVYIITDAELTTHSYSNRFAAHILRQHQFAALCKQRGWTYTLMGNWDSNNKTFINLPQWNIRAEFYVDGDGQINVANEMGILNYISTDQVRFYRDSTQLNMEDVPAIVFTEIMRDIDLFVGVTSIGNDVTWQDGGNQNLDTYWHRYSFAELSESSKIRESVLKRLIPRLKISSQCSFDGKYLIVQGKIRTYKIHIGSGNILMTPNDQYLCIVASRSTKEVNKIFLPFEGDTMLSIILSKALLLAEDDKIKDDTILNQINKK